MAKGCNNSKVVTCTRSGRKRQAIQARKGCKLTTDGPKQCRTKTSSRVYECETKGSRVKKAATKGDGLRVLLKNPKQVSGNTAPRRPPKFSFVVDGLLAGQGRPTLPGHLKFIQDLGFKYIVTLTLNKPRALNDIPDGLEWIHIPIQDETPPSVEQIRCFVSAVEKAKAEKTKIVAHCAWGRGRTGTMLACYLAKEQQLTAGEAISEIRRLRPGSVDTEKQENAIEAYVGYLKNPRS